MTRLILPVAHFDIRARCSFVHLSVVGVAIIGIACCHLFDEVAAVSGVLTSIIISPTSTSLVASIVAMIDVVVDYLFLRLFGVVDVLEIVEVWVNAASISLSICAYEAQKGHISNKLHFSVNFDYNLTRLVT